MTPPDATRDGYDWPSLSDLPCERCYFVPTPGGKCICQEVRDVDGD